MTATAKLGQVAPTKDNYSVERVHNHGSDEQDLLDKIIRSFACLNPQGSASLHEALRILLPLWLPSGKGLLN